MHSAMMAIRSKPPTDDRMAVMARTRSPAEIVDICCCDETDNVTK